MPKMTRREVLKIAANGFLGAAGISMNRPLAGVDFGHTAPRLTLPIGIQASLDSDQNLFSLDEGAVVPN